MGDDTDTGLRPFCLAVCSKRYYFFSPSFSLEHIFPVLRWQAVPEGALKGVEISRADTTRHEYLCPSCQGQKVQSVAAFFFFFFSRDITRGLNKRARLRMGSAIPSLSDVPLRAAGLSFPHYLPEASVIKKKKQKKKIFFLRGVTFMAPAFLPVLHSERRSSSGCVNEAVGRPRPSWGEWQSLA